jgi:hypothetical protein
VNINVNNSIGRVLNAEVALLDTMFNLKTMVYDVNGIPPYLQPYFFLRLNWKVNAFFLTTTPKTDRSLTLN